MLTLFIVSAAPAMAVQPGNEPFKRTWDRTDKPVLDGATSRTWMWGPQANYPIMQESYLEAPNGMRDVQYFDKARMEITDPNGDEKSIWYVTNGLLVVELITGNMQTGDATFEQRSPAVVNVAGDVDDPTGPAYATFRSLLNAPPREAGATITARVDRGANVTDDPSLAGQAVTVSLIDEVTNHAIATPFWDFMNSSGIVYENGQFVNSQLFENAFFATGRPITEAYWANVKVGGQLRDVLMQCFERRCLTYTPGNPEGFVVEAGNVGQHYYSWRYDKDASEPTPDPTPDPATQYEFLRKWGALAIVGTLDSPSQVAAAPTGEIYLAASGRHQILKFAPDGVLLDAWPAKSSPGSAFGEFNNPAGVAIDSEGFVYVTDFGNDRVQKFDADGIFITTWGAEGAAKGNFDGPYGITVGQYAGTGEDTVYVTELGNHRVQQFSLTGDFVSSWGSFGDGPAALASPHGITAAAGADVIYIADAGNNRIQMRNSLGELLGNFGSPGSNNGQFLLPVDVEVFDDGGILVTELANDRVQAFALSPRPGFNYTHAGYWGLSGIAPGTFDDPKGMALDPDGNVYIADAGNNRIQKFDGSGTYLDVWTDGNRGRFNFPSRVEVDPSGRAFVADEDLNTVQVFSPAGSFLDEWGPELPGTTPLEDPRDIAFDANNNAYIIDGARIVKLNSRGEYISQFGSPGNGEGQFDNPTSIAIDAGGNVYVADFKKDSRHGHVQKFAPDFSLVTVWDREPSLAVPEFFPIDVAVDGHEVFVLEAYSRVSVFDLDGAFLREWGSRGSEPGQFGEPVTSLAIDPDGYVYASEQSRIHKFAPDGAFLATFGGPGSGDGQFSYIAGIAVGSDFQVFAIDHNVYVIADNPKGRTCRIQVFVPVN